MEKIYQKNEIRNYSKWYLQSQTWDYIYPITLQLIKDGRKNKVLNKKIISKIQVTMIHGQKDEVVPVSYSRKVLKIFKKAKKK